MQAFDFADRYYRAGLAPGPEIIGLRQQAFEKVLAGFATNQILAAVRLSFGVKVAPQQLEWLRGPFAAKDPSFSLANDREVSLLASCLLLGSFTSDDAMLSALAVTTCAAGGIRTPQVVDTLAQEAVDCLDALSVANVPPTPPDIKGRVPALSKATNAEIVKLAQGPDLAAAATVIKKAADESIAGAQLVASESYASLRALIDHARRTQQELDMLWWYVGGWSSILNAPFATASAPAQPLVLGMELARLTHIRPGPFAARALLYRLLSSSKASIADTAVSLEEATTGLLTHAPGVAVPEVVQDVLDLCPVLSAVVKALEIGAAPAWFEAYRRATGITEGESLPAIDLGIEVYRECLLLSELSDRADRDEDE